MIRLYHDYMKPVRISFSFFLSLLTFSFQYAFCLNPPWHFQIKDQIHHCRKCCVDLPGCFSLLYLIDQMYPLEDYVTCISQTSSFERHIQNTYSANERSISASLGGRLSSKSCIITVSTSSLYSNKHALMNPCPKSGNRSWICDILATSSKDGCK